MKTSVVEGAEDTPGTTDGIHPGPHCVSGDNGTESYLLCYEVVVTYTVGVHVWSIGWSGAVTVLNGLGAVNASFGAVAEEGEGNCTSSTILLWCAFTVHFDWGGMH